VTQTRFPTTSEVIALNGRVLGRLGGLIDEGKLSGGLLRAQQVAHYEGGDPATIAGYLIAGVALAHAFADGNKRTAFATMLLFLGQNGLDLAPDDEYMEVARRIEAYVADRGSREETFAGLVATIRRLIVQR
jgi:death-on-curing family protein